MSFRTLYISRADADAAQCAPIVEALRQRGIPLESDLHRANTMVTMISPAALDSVRVNDEMRLFGSLMMQDPTRLFIPVKVAPCEMPSWLATRWWVDATTQPVQQVVDLLALALTVPDQPAAPLVPQPSTPAAQPVVAPALTPTIAPSSSQQGFSAPYPTPTSAPTPSVATPKGISRRTLIVGGVVGAAAIGAGVIWFTRSSSAPGGTQAGAIAPFTYRGHSYPVFSVAWSPDGKRIASAGGDFSSSGPDIAGGLQVWDAAGGGHVFAYHGHRYTINSIVDAIVAGVAWSPDGRRIASAGDDNAQVFDAADGGHPLTYRGHPAYVNAIAWSPDGQRIASAGRDNVQVWDASNGNHIFTFAGHTGSVNSVAWSPDSTRVASGSNDGTVQVWAVGDSNALVYNGHSYNGNSEAVWCVDWSPDGKRIVSTSGYPGGPVRNGVQVWNPLNGSTVFTYTGHSDAVVSVVWSPDGKRIASASVDKTAQVWKATDGSRLFIYRGHTSQVNSVTWSPSGLNIASGSMDKTVQVWRPQ